MKALLSFALRIMGLRLLVIGLSLAQVTLWAAELGLAGFGVAQTLISAQMLLGLLGRFGADNVLVRQFRTDPAFPGRFPAYRRAAMLASVAVAGLGLAVLVGLVLDSPLGISGAVVFVALLVGFNLVQILSQIAIAEKRQVLVTLLQGVLPVAVSVGLFLLPLPAGLADHPLAPRHVQAVGFLAIGYGVAALALVLALRGFHTRCRDSRGADPARMRLILSPEQWHFVGYQSMGLARAHGITLVVMALFGPTTAGVFALALRFGNLLTYLNEPARMYVLPRIAGSGPDVVLRMYRRMLVLNAGLGVVGIALLLGLYAFVDLPFSTAPPFALYTFVIMAGAAVNLFVGPVGAILAQSGNERHNLMANSLGLVVAGLCLGLAWALAAPFWAVLAVALSNVAINLSNTVSLMRVLCDPNGLA